MGYKYNAIESVLDRVDDPTLAGIVDAQIPSVPGLIYSVKGGSSDGGNTPDTTTQTDIDTLVAAGVPLANIVWYYVSTEGVVFFTMPVVSMSETITVPDLSTQAGGTGVMNFTQITMVETCSVPSLFGAMTGELTMPAVSMSETITPPELALASVGSIEMPTASMSETITVPDLVCSVGSITMPAVSMSETITVPTLTGVGVDAISGFTYDFTGTSGSWDGTKWPTQVGTTLASNAGDLDNGDYAVSQGVTFSNTFYAKVKMWNPDGDPSDDYDSQTAMYIHDSSGDSSHNSIVLTYKKEWIWDDDGEEWTFYNAASFFVDSYNSGGTPASHYGSTAPADGDLIGIRMNSSTTQFYVTKNGSDWLGPYTSTWTAPSTVKIIISGYGAGAGAFDNGKKVDDFDCGTP